MAGGVFFSNVWEDNCLCLLGVRKEKWLFVRCGILELRERRESHSVIGRNLVPFV